MSEKKIKFELNEKELSSVSAGKDVNTIVNELMPLASQYPEIIEILEAYNRSDYGTLITLLQKFATSHPELASFFED